MSRFIFLIFTLTSFGSLHAQELKVSVKINIQKIQTVDPKVFATLETTIDEFLNSQKWTNDIFEKEERINCNFLLTIQEELSPTSFKADLAIQASRPVFGTDYETAILNHIDRDVTFVYEQFQPLVFSKNSYNDNLSQVLSFYVYLILGLDYDSYSLYGGEEHLRTTQEILNNVPQSAAAGNPGWQSLDANRNRFWIIENLLSPRVRDYRQAMYDYHRQSLDIMYTDTNTARAILISALEKVRTVNQAYPNSMIVQMFANAKSTELVEIFKRGTIQEKNRFIQIMTKVDAPNASKYRAVR